MYRISWLALAAALGALAPAHALAEAPNPRLELQLKGDAGNLGVSGGVFVPFVLENGAVVFADGWLDYTPDGPVSGSLGGGVRTEVGGVVLGGNASLDILRSRRGLTYHQLALGLEALASDWEFRLNGHIPLGDTAREVNSLSKADVADGRFVVNQGYEVALYGVNAEVGLRLPVFEADSAATWKAYAGVYAHGSALTPTVTGLSLRTELSMPLDVAALPGASLAFGGGLRYDSNHALNGGAYVRLSVPFGGSHTASNSADPLYQRVERNRAITLDAGAFGAAETAVARTGSDKVLNVSANDGVASNINALIAAAGEGAVVLASGDIAVDQTLALASNQILLGGGGVLDVTTARGQKVAYTNPGAPTTLHAGAGTPSGLAAPVLPDMLRLASGSTVSTLSIAGGQNGIVAHRVNGISIDRVSIADVAGNGIVLDSVNGAAVTASNIARTPICGTGATCGYTVFKPDQVPHAGINAVGSSNLLFRDLDIRDVTYGIFAAADIEEVNWTNTIVSPASNIRIDNVAITNTRQEAFMAVAAEKVSIDGLHIDNRGMAQTKDLVVFMSSHGIDMSNSTLRGGINALMFAHYFGLPSSKPQDITVTNVDIADTSRSGIFMNPSLDVTFKDVSIANAGGYGVHFHADGSGFNGGPVQNVTFDDVRVNGAKDGAVYVSGPLENISGNLATTNVDDACDAATASWARTSITQANGVRFSIDGQTLDTAALAAC